MGPAGAPGNAGPNGKPGEPGERGPDGQPGEEGQDGEQGNLLKIFINLFINSRDILFHKFV